MNIQFLNFSNINSYDKLKVNKPVNEQVKYSSYPNLKPLAQDTVSFTSKKKIVQTVTEEIVDNVKKNKKFVWDPKNKKSMTVINSICESFDEPLKKFLFDLRRVLRPITCTESNPEGIIMSGKSGIHGRVKEPKKVARKANKRNITTVEEIEKMGDVGGVRITLRTASHQETAKVFEGIKEIVKKGYKVIEVENYRPTAKESYVAQKTLDDFEAFCVKHGYYPKVISQPLGNGYSAIHILFELPDGKVIELQIMGRDVENYKNVEDLFYKYRCNEKFSEEYEPIEKIFKKLIPKLDDFQKETLERYHKDSYEHARHIPPRSAKIRFAPERDFLPWPYSLPPELNPVNLYYKMIECKKVAVNAKPKQ